MVQLVYYAQILRMNPEKQRISMIAAVGKKTRAIGLENKLLWQLEGDLPRFKRITAGHPVIMGRNTWLSLSGKPLPGRTNIVITSKQFEVPEGILIAHSLEEALEKAKQSSGNDEVFVIGGGRVYTDALPYADRIYLTIVEDDKGGDTFFPEYESEFTKVVEHERNSAHIPPFEYVTVERE